LSKVLAGHPSYEVLSGEIIYEGKDLLELEPDERAREGVFLRFNIRSKFRACRIRSFCGLLTTKK
jgi:Fe-S cluster assembly ATPase SufC